MRCVFRRASCPNIPANTACFECENCHKRVLAAEVIAARIDEITRSFPDCGAQTAAPTGMTSSTEPVATPPAPALAPAAAPYVWDPAGAGTQLKRLLAKVGITSTENCSCNARARLMNERGIEWCEQNVNEIVGWLKEEAGRRKLPFLSFPTKILVQRAIKIAKKVRAAMADAAENAEEAADSSSIIELSDSSATVA